MGRQLDQTFKQARDLVSLLKTNNLHLTAMESCTGGAFTDILTSIPGASGVLEFSTITYSNAAKMALGVPEDIIKKYTVYSREVAEAMAQASLALATTADIGISITGSLSRIDPSNSTNSVPGEVHIGIASANDYISETVHVVEEDRYAAKLHVVRHAIRLTVDFIKSHPC